MCVLYTSLKCKNKKLTKYCPKKGNFQKMPRLTKFILKIFPGKCLDWLFSHVYLLNSKLIDRLAFT